MATNAWGKIKPGYFQSHPQALQDYLQKKSLKALERNEVKRAEFRASQLTLAGKRVRVLDETSINVAMTRRYGWAAQNERCYGEVAGDWGKNISVLTTLTSEGVDLASTIYFEGGLNSAIFEHYMLEILLPHLVKGEIVILDNLSCHKSEKIEAALAKKGCKILFLPAYSPDLSPIELAFAKIKEYLRAVGARTKEALEEALEQALNLITPSDAAAFFKHCGYTLVAQ